MRLSDEKLNFIQSLLDKGDKANEKTSEHANADITVYLKDAERCNHLRIDDPVLLYTCIALMPNIVNYTFNALVQFLYPFIVSYLQDLSEGLDDPFTVRDLFDLINNFDLYGNFFDGPETKD